MRRGPWLLAALAAAAIAAAGGGPGAGEAADRKTEAAMGKAYTIGRLDGGRFAPVGTLTFDAENTGHLALEAEGPEAEALARIWEDIRDRESLQVRRTRRATGPSGGTVTQIVGVIVPRSAKGWPEAVIDHLSQQHGYFGRPAGD